MTMPEVNPREPNPLIGIVGPCGAGKSTLAAGLKPLGIRVRPIAQEHSYVRGMWKQLTKPDILIFLQVSHEVAAIRRNMKWTKAEWQEQQLRLLHAREHADLFINTDSMSIEEVLASAVSFLESHL